jgi:hypothetical protein
MRRQGKVVGLVWLEDPVDTTEYRQFPRVLASLAALRGDRMSTRAQLRRLDHEAMPAELEAVRSLSADLATRELNATAADDGIYPEVCVFVVQVDDLACAANGGAPDLISSVAQAMQEVAAEHKIPYLKVVGCDIVAAVGFTTGDHPLLGAARCAPSSPAPCGRPWVAGWRRRYSHRRRDGL